MSLWGFCKKVYRVCRESVYHIPKKIFVAAAKLKKDHPRILLITHELEYTGAPIVLFNIAKILKKYNFEVFVISYLDGKLAERYREIGVPVYIVRYIHMDRPGFIKLVKMFDLVIANTIVTYRAVWYMKDYVKFIWLIHEALCFETDLFKFYSVAHYGCPSIVDILKNVGKIYTVSEYSKKVFSKYTDNIDVIHNGLVDEGQNLIPEKKEDAKLTFSFIGLINKRKACDVLIEAIRLLPESYRKRVTFKFAGNVRDDFGRRLKRKYKDDVEWLGEISDRKLLKELYLQTDVLICVSRDDTAPLVVAEAAMFGVPSVISQNVGSTYLIKDGESGFVVPTEDAKALCDVFVKIIDNPDILIPMRKKVRENYLKTSTMEIFENNFMKIVNDKLGIASEQ